MTKCFEPNYWFHSRKPLSSEKFRVLETIPAEKMADCLPDTLEDTTIDLLIGSEDIIGNDKVILPSGMV